MKIPTFMCVSNTVGLPGLMKDGDDHRRKGMVGKKVRPTRK